MKNNESTTARAADAAAIALAYRLAHTAMGDVVLQGLFAQPDGSHGWQTLPTVLLPPDDDEPLIRGWNA